MTDKQQDKKTSQKSGESIGFLRASEKMQIATFDIPLTFLEDLGFSPDKIQAAKYFNRRFVSGFYSRVRGIGERLSFSGGRKAAAEEKATKAAGPAEKTTKPEVRVKPKPEATGKSAKPEVQVKPKPEATGKSAKPEIKAPSE